MSEAEQRNRNRPHVFISYAHADKAFVLALRNALKGYVNAWLDDVDISIGDNIVSKITAAISDSDYLILVLSKESLRSRWVEAEWTSAFIARKDSPVPIIPVLKDDIDIPLLLRPLRLVDFTKSFESGIAVLKDFFKFEGIATDSRFLVRKSDDCPSRLFNLSNADLRRTIATRMSLRELALIWFDVLGGRMDDELPGQPIGNAAMELLLRTEQRKLRDPLVRALCQERPDLAS